MSIEIPDTFFESARRSKIVCLGECDHYIKEKYQYQLDLVRALVPLGFEAIGIESGYFEIKESEKWRSAMEIEDDPPDSGGLLAISESIHEEYLKRIAAAEEKFFDELAKLGFRKGEQIFGFDVDKDLDFISTLATEEFSDLERHVVNYSLSFIEKASGDPSEEILFEAFNQREEIMEKIVREQLLRNDKVILLGHNGHLSKDSGEYAIAGGDETEPKLSHSWRLLGDRLKTTGFDPLCVFQIANRVPIRLPSGKRFRSKFFLRRGPMKLRWRRTIQRRFFFQPLR